MTLDKQANQSFKNLFASLVKARRLLQLMSELIESGVLTKPLDLEQPPASEEIGQLSGSKRKRTE
jgi:hypothetical protein